MPSPDSVTKESAVVTALGGPNDDKPLHERVKTFLVGKPRDIHDQTVFHSVSLVAFLAWVGLGADGLSSSCYGPPEAFHNLHGHTYLAVFLSLATMLTVFVISKCYSHIIEEFPSGGGGYLVASKLLGRRAGVVSGCALLVDYMLTITVSIAAAGDALYGLFGPYVRQGVEWLRAYPLFFWLPLPSENWKLYGEYAAIMLLIVMNLRGVRESVKALLPVFMLFLAMHLLLIAGSVLMHLSGVSAVAQEVTGEVKNSLANPDFGLWAMLALLLRAYSMGAGTYTGIEAVSNSMPVMREPRVATAKRTMIYMACSLAFTAGGLMLAYLLLQVSPKNLAQARRVVDGREESIAASELKVGDEVVVEAGEMVPGDGEVIDGSAAVDESSITGNTESVAHKSRNERSAVTSGTRLISGRITVRIFNHKTLNQALTEKFLDDMGIGAGGLGGLILWLTMISEGALLFVAAQAGFIDGPRVLANMAHDSFMPHWFANLSERLASHNGILLMGIAALLALWHTGGNVTALVIMYSINVFLTFSLSMLGMCRHWWQQRGASPIWHRRFALFAFGAMMCLSILSVTIYEKFREGGYVTLLVTGLLVAMCFLTRRYYRGVVERLKRLNASLGDVTTTGPLNLAEPDTQQPTAAILVGGYGGLGVHTLLNAVRFGHSNYKNVIFLSAGIVDSGNFKGAGAVEDLQRHTESALGQYVDLARRLGLPATSFMSIGTDAVDELEHLCLAVAKRFPRVVFFAGQLVFNRDTWYQRLFHNQTAFSLQRRLQWDGIPMVILPTRVR
jgi:amino acid transporter